MIPFIGPEFIAALRENARPDREPQREATAELRKAPGTILNVACAAAITVALALFVRWLV